MPKAADYTLVFTGPKADVRLGPEALEAYRKLTPPQNADDAKRKRELERYFEFFCNNEKPSNNTEHFKREGQYRMGNGKKVDVYAFKPWQMRIYGSIRNVDGKRCFVGVVVDPAKKDNKAKARMLKRAGERLGEIDEFNGK